MNTPPVPPASQGFGGLAFERGHFVFESGLHGDIWLELDTLFIDPVAIAPSLSTLAGLIDGHGVTAICGPLLGGAFVAQAIAIRLGLRFYVAQRIDAPIGDNLFAATYRLPDAQRKRAQRERFAVVDDVISAGSSVRATVTELSNLGAKTLVVGGLLTLGNRAAQYFAQSAIPVVSPAAQEYSMWEPVHCPLCIAGVPIGPT